MLGALLSKSHIFTTKISILQMKAEAHESRNLHKKPEIRSTGISMGRQNKSYI